MPRGGGAPGTGCPFCLQALLQRAVSYPPRVHVVHKEQKDPQGFGARSACRAFLAPEERRGPGDQM